MKKLGRLSLALFLLASYSQAADLSVKGINGASVDLSPLANYLYSKTQVLTKPRYVYNWFNATGHRPQWQSQFDPSDPSMGLAHLSGASTNYLDSLCADPSQNPSDCPSASDLAQLIQQGGGNVFGPGLYMSTDPVATYTYGGGGNTWVVLQIKLPKGARILDLTLPEFLSFPPQDVLTVLNNMGCGITSTEYVFAYAHATSGSCGIGFRKVLKNALQLDAFMYNYSATSFPECGQGPSNHRNAALVLTSDRLFSSSGTPGQDPDTIGEVKAFNALSTGAKEDRLRIESLFQELGYASYPWADLQGQMDPKAGAWIQQNLFGCSADADMAPLQGKAPSAQVDPMAQFCAAHPDDYYCKPH